MAPDSPIPTRTAAPASPAFGDKVSDPIVFMDLAAQRRRIGPRLDAAVRRVIERGEYIMGPEVGALETQLARFAGARHAISCSSGTDALALALMAWNIGPGDAVFVPAFTFAATAEVVAMLRATPVFCDIDPHTFTMAPDSLSAALDLARTQGLRPRAVIPVDLFGQPADYRRIAPLAAGAGLLVLADAAQSFGATLDGQRVGTLAQATATSFFPAKPLGGYGDGGAVFTDDDDLAEVMRSLRVHGKGRHKYDNVRVGMNGRLDTMQAAILLEKLAIFEDEIAARWRVAARYATGLAGVVELPEVLEGATSVWAQYTIRCDGRDELAARLKAAGVPTAIYYPLPLHRQTAYREFPTAPGGLPVSDRLAERVLSLPMHPYLGEATQDRIIGAVRAACA